MDSFLHWLLSAKQCNYRLGSDIAISLVSDSYRLPRNRRAFSILFRNRPLYSLCIRITDCLRNPVEISFSSANYVRNVDCLDNRNDLCLVYDSPDTRKSRKPEKFENSLKCSIREQTFKRKEKRKKKEA